MMCQIYQLATDLLEVMCDLLFLEFSWVMELTIAWQPSKYLLIFLSLLIS
jgi:hypothetical protein